MRTVRCARDEVIKGDLEVSTTGTIEKGSAADLYGMEISTIAKRVVDELREAELMDDDLEPEDYALACIMISAAIAENAKR